MAEMRLIDANSLLSYMSDMEVHSRKKCCTTAIKSCIDEFFPQVIADQPTIDPETLPIVRELREKLERVKMERDSLLKELAGECGLCKHYVDCRLNNHYCHDGEKWEWIGLGDTE